MYRGHADIRWKIIPSLFRYRKLYRKESDIVRELITMQPDHFLNDQSMFDRLVRMQHFSLQTRLLDVTWNPLVALYFCVNAEPDRDGQVLAIGFNDKDDKFFDSDTVSCVSNLALMKPSERNVLRRSAAIEKRRFNKIPAARRLVNFVKSEKPYFQSIIKPEDLHRNLLVRPKLSNRRVLAQNGAFILFGLKHKPLEENLGNFEVQYISIRKEYKADIAKQLDLMGFNIQSLFPELEYASRYIAGKYGD